MLYEVITEELQSRTLLPALAAHPARRQYAVSYLFAGTLESLAERGEALTRAARNNFV